MPCIGNINQPFNFLSDPYISSISDFSKLDLVIESKFAESKWRLYNKWALKILNSNQKSFDEIKLHFYDCSSDFASMDFLIHHKSDTQLLQQKGRQCAPFLKQLDEWINPWKQINKHKLKNIGIKCFELQISFWIKFENSSWHNNNEIKTAWDAWNVCKYIVAESIKEALQIHFGSIHQKNVYLEKDRIYLFIKLTSE